MSTMMSTGEMSAAPFEHAAGSQWIHPLQSAIALAGTLLARIRKYIAYRSARERLATLDDRLLRDIGLSRDMIDAAVLGRSHGSRRQAVPQWPVI